MYNSAHPTVVYDNLYPNRLGGEKLINDIYFDIQTR